MIPGVSWRNAESVWDEEWADAQRLAELGIEDARIERRPMELRDQFGRVLKRRKPSDLERVIRAERLLE